MVNIQDKNLVDVDTISTDINFILTGLGNIKKEIQVLEGFNDQERINSYLNNLIDFAGDALDEVEEITKLFDQTKIEFIEISEKLGEKKTHGEIYFLTN